MPIYRSTSFSGVLRADRCQPLATQCLSWPSSIALQEHGTKSQSAIGDHAHLRVLHLSQAGPPPELQTCFVAMPKAMKSASRELPAAGVQRQLPVKPDPLPPLDERARLSAPAQPQALKPQQHVDRKPVIDLG